MIEQLSAVSASLDMPRAVWGGGPWARWIRSMTVWSLFVCRHLPIIGKDVSALVFAVTATYLMIFE